MLTVLAALQSEAETLLSLSRNVRERAAFGKKIYEGEFDAPYRLILTGVGKSDAAAGAMLGAALDDGGQTVLLNIGVAGGLNGRAPVGSVLQIERAVQFDFDLSKINGTPVGTLNEYKTPYLPLAVRGAGAFPRAALGSADRFGDGRDADLLRDLAADVQDMEGAAIAHVADLAGIPLFMFKAISDNAQEESVREYRENLQIALGALRGRMHEIFAEALGGEEAQ